MPPAAAGGAYTSSLSFAPPGSTMHLRRHEGFQLPPPPSGHGGGQLVYRSGVAVNGGGGAPVREFVPKRWPTISTFFQLFKCLFIKVDKKISERQKHVLGASK